MRLAAILASLASLASLACLALPASARAIDAKSLVGTWSMQADPSSVLVLKPDGTGTFAGERIRWQLRGDRLAVTDAHGQTDENVVRVDGDALGFIGAGGMVVLFSRVGGDAGKKSAPSPALFRGAGEGEKRASASAGGSAQDQQLRELLLSSAWCSFSYKATPGGGGYGDHSSSSRVVFRRDGTALRGSSSETYSAGTGGQYAGARQGGGGLRWQVQGGRLLVDVGAGRGYQDVNLVVTRNSSGYPILKAAGTEYMTCR